jgi:hypothetical protein
MDGGKVVSIACFPPRSPYSVSTPVIELLPQTGPACWVFEICYPPSRLRFCPAVGLSAARGASERSQRCGNQGISSRGTGGRPRWIRTRKEEKAGVWEVELTHVLGLEEGLEAIKVAR